MAGNRNEFQRLNAEFQHETRKDKECYWNAPCGELEEAHKKGHIQELFGHVKKACAPFAPRKATTVTDRIGTELHDDGEIKRRWREYTEELYVNDGGDQSKCDDEIEMEPEILEDEVERALKQLSRMKAPGTNSIPAELLKPLPQSGC